MSDNYHHTRCPECHTVFRVSDAQLEIAGGKVRCGQCKAVFYAQVYFIETEIPGEDTTASAAESPPADTATPTPTNEPLRGNYDFVEEPPADTTPFTERGLPVEDIELTDLSYARFDAEGENSEHFDLDAGAQTEATPPAEVVPDTASTEAPSTPTAGDDAPRDNFLREADNAESGAPVAEADAEAEEPDASRALDTIATTAESEDEPGDDTALDSFLAETGVVVEDDASLSEDAEAAPDVGMEEEAGADTPADTTVEETVSDRESVAEEAGTAPGEAEIDDFDAGAPTPAEPAAPDTIPYALRESLAAAEKKPPGLAARLALLLILLVLTATLGIQAIYFRGLDIAQRFPAARPLVDAVCERLDCRYTGPRDVARIRLVNRDIRAARERDGVLVITATMVNEADFAQPFPIFEVVLSDLTGTAVAERRFTPEEYLGSLVKEQFLMQPGQPVRVTLEVMDPGSDAVNFEINFL